MIINADATDVILFTRGTKGDLYPFLRMGAGLRLEGCHVTLMSNYCYENYAISEGLNFIALDDQESFETLNNMPEFHTNLPSLLGLYKTHILTKLEDEVVLIGDGVKPNSIILAHSNDYLSPLFAMEKFGVSLYICMLAPSFSHGLFLFEAVLSSLSNELNDLRAKIGLPRVVNWKTWLRKFQRCFAFWPQWYSDEARKIVPDLDYLGFLSIDSVEKAGLQDSIKSHVSEKNNPLVLVTHGTSKPFNDNFFELCIAACNALNCKVIVSTPFRKLLPEALPTDVLWVEFCPFHELLPFVDLVIHHGGIGTAREAIFQSKPQLIIGQGFDRQHNGRAIKGLGVGDWINPSALSKEILCEKINALINNELIISQCDLYGPGLYDDEALARFYKSVVHHLEEKAASVDYINPFSDSNIYQQTEGEINLDHKLIGEKPEHTGNGHSGAKNRQELIAKLLKERLKHAKNIIQK